MTRKTYEQPSQTFQSIGKITIQPHQEIQFFIGLYENIIPQPITKVTYRPKNNQQVLASLIRTDNIGDYTLAYQFTNISNEQFTIEIETKWSD